MRPQMDLPYSSLQQTNGFKRSLQLFLRDGLARKHVVELSLLLDQLVAQYDGFRLHRLEQRFGARSLVGRKRELSRERYNVRRTGVVIELGGLRKTHAFSLKIGRDLVGRERLDLAVFRPHVRRSSRVIGQRSG